VIPSLQREQVNRFASGELTLDALTRAFIRQHLKYQFAQVQSSVDAYALERECRMGITFGANPLLDPA